MPRKSERISKRQSLSGPLPHIRGGMNSPPISDGDINNCNLRICDQGTGVESPDLWDEEEVIKEYLCMEERDTEFAKGVEEGDKDGSS